MEVERAMRGDEEEEEEEEGEEEENGTKVEEKEEEIVRNLSNITSNTNDTRLAILHPTQAV